MKFIVLNIFLLCTVIGNSQSTVSSDDLQLVIGNWEGSLTYLDYSSGKPYIMPADVMVTQGKDDNTIVLKNSYPKEPKANNTDKIKLSKNGALLNKHAVTSREILEDGNIQVLTEHTAKDAGEKALIRYTYTIGTDTFRIRKDVQFAASPQWIQRSEFSYQRVK